jgi:hypothetical protein
LCWCFLPEMRLFPLCDLALAADQKDGTGSSGRKIFVTIPLGNGKRQNADPRSMDYLRGPGPWTTLMDHGPLLWTTLVDHLQNFAYRTID